MAEIVATAVAEEAARSCFQMIGHYITYTRKYKRNIQRLRVELQKIDGARDTISREVRIAENNAEDIRQDVLGWLQKCQEIKNKVNELSARPFQISCLCCSCPNLKSRYLASSEAVETTSLITQHLGEGKFDKVGQQPQLGQSPLLSPGEFHDFGSRTVIIEEVMDGLKDDSIFVIGLCGMGGIGKTMLVKEIAEKVKNKKIFDEVAFAVVSQTENVKAIQDELAFQLELKAMANEMAPRGRAGLLYKRLMDEKKRILVILDDIWQELNLHSVGIPVHGDRKGFKIIMTTRFDSVCVDMKVQKRLPVGVLSKDEAWNLFKMTAGIDDDTIPEKAEEVLQKCAGLPLAIVIVGKSLRKNKTEHAYRDMLRTLRENSTSNTSRVQKELYSCIKSSYDYLESDEHRSLLLLCSIFPEDYDIPVEDLVRYARGLFDTSRDRAETIVDELMKCYLLLVGEKRKCVKLHDVVRDICLSITSQSGDAHILLKFDDLRERLSGLKSRRLRLLRLVNREDFQKSYFSSAIMELQKTTNKDIIFSEEMQELKVLEVNHITTSLPLFQQFLSLQTVSLDYCRLTGDFAAIGRLKMLRILSFFHSVVEMFPTEIAELTKLQCLDLRFHLIQPTKLLLKTVSSLKELEELYLGDNVSGDIESLKEVCSLSKLNTIQFVVSYGYGCLNILLENLNLSELIRFDIAQTGQYDKGVIEYQIRDNVLELMGNNVHIDVNLMKQLMRRVKCFSLNGEGLTNVVDVLGEESGFPNLKELLLENCDMKCLVDATNHLPKGVFNKLEKLKIKTASQLEELIYGEHPLGTHIRLHEWKLENLNRMGHSQCLLYNLKKLEICDSDKMKSLFSKYMMNCLGNLEEIIIRSCSIFERIVSSQKDEELNCSEVLQFRTLRRIVLYRLRSLDPRSDMMAGFNQAMCPKLEEMEIRLCDPVKERREEAAQELCFYLESSLPAIRSLDVEECNNLLTIAKSGLIHGFQDLQKLRVWDCLSLEVVFDFEEIVSHVSAETEETTLLGQLESLDLFSLPKLKHIWTMFPPKGILAFTNLKSISVYKCGSLRYLLTPTIAAMLVHLEKIWLQENGMMEGIIGWDEINEPNDGEEVLLGKIVLPNLKSLEISYLPSFRKLCCCSPDVYLEFPSLSKLDIPFMVQDIFTRDQIPRLTSLSIGKSVGDWRYLLTPTSAELLLSVRELELYGDEHIEAAQQELCFYLDSSLPTIRYLLVSQCNNLLTIAKSGLIHGFKDLQKLWVSDCLSVEVVFDFEEIISHVNAETTLLGQLESLDLFSLPELKHIWTMLPQKGILAFTNLKSISVYKCGSLRYLLTPTIAAMLVHLEKIWLQENDMMEGMIGWDEINEPNDGEEVLLGKIVLPNLKSLYISKLRSFRKLCCCSPDVYLELPSLSELDITFMVQDIFTRDQIPRLTSLSIGKSVGDWRYLLTPTSAELLLSVRELELYDDEQIEAILGSDEPSGEDDTRKSIAFPELRKLTIIRLSKLRNLSFSPYLNLELPSLTELQIYSSPVDILTRGTHALQNLTTLRVEWCETSKYLFTSSISQVLVHLEELVLYDNISMEAIFGYETSAGEEVPNKTIVLPKLRMLEISGLENLRMLCCSLSLNVDLPSLTRLLIGDCPKMSKLCAGQLSAPQLKHVNYGWREKEVPLGTFINSWLKDCEALSRCLECTDDGIETCHHLDNQKSESENSSSGEGSEQEESLESGSSGEGSEQEESLESGSSGEGSEQEESLENGSSGEGSEQEKSQENGSNIGSGKEILEDENSNLEQSSEIQEL